MKILLISTCWNSTPPHGYGPSEEIANAITNGLIRLGHDVTLFATGDSQTKAKLAYQFKEYPSVFDPLSEIKHVDAAFQFAASQDFDIIHNQDASYGIRKCLSLKTPHITRMSWLGDKKLKTFMCSLTKRQYNRLKFTAISQRQRDLIPYLNWVATIYNGLEIDDFPFDPQRRGEFLLFLGRINEEKGVDIAVEVALKTSIPLVIAGIVRPEWQAFFDTKIKPYIDGKNIRWVGKADQALKRELYTKALAFLMPIRWEEPFGIVMVEAMACGVPVIAFRRGSVPEIIKHTKTGFVVDTADGMVEALQKVSLINPADCREHVATNFSSTAMTQGYIQVYQKLLQSWENQNVRI